MVRVLVRIYIKIRRYLAECFDPRAQLPKNIPDDAIIEYMTELERSRKNGGH
ncbi:hypothetical protein K2X30_10245 [bacterium]|nr:hypothetical protein [bacterium]